MYFFVYYTAINNIALYITCRERDRKIKVNQKSGVIQKPAERNELEATVTTYFTDTLPSFVNHLAKEHNATNQEEIMRLFMVS